MEHFIDNEVALKLIEDAVLLANGSRDEGLDDLASLYERFVPICKKFSEAKEAMTLQEIQVTLIATLRIYMDAFKFFRLQEELRFEPGTVKPLEGKTFHDAYKRPFNLSITVLNRYIKFIPIFYKENIGKKDNWKTWHCFTDLAIVDLLSILNKASHDYYHAAWAVHDIKNLGALIERKQSTIGARSAKSKASEAVHELIVATFNELRKEEPGISKNAASLKIGKRVKINMTPQVIRKHLTKI